jgi:hypothetical protein
MGSMTVEDVRKALARMPTWFEVTVTNGDAHYNISGVTLGKDDEDDDVVTITVKEA